MSTEVVFGLYTLLVVLIAVNLMWVGALHMIRGLGWSAARSELNVCTLQALAVLLILSSFLYFLQGEINVPIP